MIDECLFVANVSQHHFGIPMSGHFHDFVDPRVVYCRTRYKPSPKGVSGILLRIKTNPPSVALNDPRDITWIEWMA